MHFALLTTKTSYGEHRTRRATTQYIVICWSRIVNICCNLETISHIYNTATQFMVVL